MEVHAEAAPATGKPPIKQFPLKLIMISFGGFVLLMLILIVVTSFMKGHREAADQMTAVSLPQPQLQTPQPTMQPVPPLPQGQSQNAYGQQVAGTQPPLVQNAMQSPAYNAPNGPQTPSNGQQYANPSQQAAPGTAMGADRATQPPQQGLQPSAAVPGPVLGQQQQNGQEPAQSGQFNNQGGPESQDAYRPSGQTVKTPSGTVNVQPQSQQVSIGFQQGSWAGVAPDNIQNQVSSATAEPRPARTLDAGTVAALQRQLSDMQKQLTALEGAPGGQNLQTTKSKSARIYHGDSAKAVASSDDGDTSDDASPSSGLQSNTASDGKQHESHVQRKGRGKPKDKIGDKSGQDSSYTLTGMIDNRAFVSRNGSADVNSAMTLAPGDTLDDGRKVLQIDPKTRRVWLSGGSFIGVAPDGVNASDSGTVKDQQ